MALFQVADLTSVRNIYLTKGMTSWGYPGFDDWWCSDGYPQRFRGIDETGFKTACFFHRHFLCLETVALGFKKMKRSHKNDNPIIQLLQWLAMSPHTLDTLSENNQARGKLARYPPRFRRLELVFEKKGKEIDNPLDLDSYLSPPNGFKWVQTRVSDDFITKRGRYINDWNYFKKMEAQEEEEGDIMRVEMERIQEIDWTDFLDTFPESISTVFE
ncbi:hypothetical protein TWF730_000263 [Orbilia blumenaviensis]|uniref:Uncharacterized protein n=1 Tax=Orbilia blumenaviensis TaxID=1796055 RepID=A0AAV9VL10_9PEZI